MSDIQKTKKKLKIVRDDIVGDDVMHTMASRILNYMQKKFKNINFYHFSLFSHNFSYFLYILFSYFINDALFPGQYSYDHYKRANI